MSGRTTVSARSFSGQLNRGLLVVVIGLAGAQLAPSSASADPAPSAWASLRSCESGGNYQAVSRTGKHMGAYQFDQGTWNSVGGAGRPDQASAYEQDYRALYLYRMRGWQPWTCATSRHLVQDADARSRRVPTAAEASALSGASADGTVTTTTGTTTTGDTTTGSTATAAPTVPVSVPAPWPGSVKSYRYGQCNAAIRTFQLAMNVRGYPTTFQGTSCYYSKTRAAVLAVQVANGIPAHGRLNHRTWNAAFLGAAPQ